MPYKSKEEQKKYHQNWYKRNKKRLKEKAAKNNKIYRQRNREYVRDYKLSHGCADCGYNKHYAALDFDHISDDKEHTIAKMVGSAICSIETLMKEIRKCEVVCSNCHRIRTWNRLQ